MRTQVRLIVLPVVAVCAAALLQAQAQIADPIPEKVVKRGLMVEVRDLVRLPQTRGKLPPDQDVNPAGWARPSFLRDAADGRRFVNDRKHDQSDLSTH